MIPRWKRNYLRYKSYLLNVVTAYQKREDIKAYLELVLSLVTILVFSTFAIKPTLTTIGSLLKEIETKKQTVKMMDEKIANLAAARTVYDSQLSNINLLKTAIPEGPNPGEFARQIEGVSNSNSVAILGFTTDQVTLTPNQIQQDANKLTRYSQGGLGFTLNTTGDYQLLLSMLKAAEGLLRPAKFDSLNFGLAGQTAGNILVFTLSGQTPFIMK